MVEGERSVPAVARDCFKSPEGRRLFSVASLWEMSIKFAIGKLELRSGSIERFAKTLLLHGVELLPVLSAEAMDVASRPRDRHHDPSGRLIAAQSGRYRLPLISIDAAFDAKVFAYGGAFAGRSAGAA